jgi:hypothetical protein
LQVNSNQLNQYTFVDFDGLEFPNDYLLVELCRWSSWADCFFLSKPDVSEFIPDVDPDVSDPNVSGPDVLVLSWSCLILSFFFVSN